MNDRAVYNAARILAAVLMIGSAAIAAAVGMDDLQLSRQTIAVLSLVQVVISAALGFLPRVQGGTPPGRRATDVLESPAPRG